jgi:SulP family sulfate permease
MLLRAWIGGGVGALATLAVLITLGWLAYAAAGERAIPIGVPAAMVATLAGGVVVALISRCHVPTAGPSTATALTLASLVARLAADGPLAAHPQSWTLIVAAAGAAVIGMGLVQLVLAVMGLARLVHFVPQPVLAGFMNGVALLIMLSQVPTLLGHALAVGWGGLASALSEPHLAPLALGLATTTAILWLASPGRHSSQPRAGRWPAVLLGLIGGALAFHAVGWLTGSDPQALFGPRLGALPVSLPEQAVWPLAADRTAWSLLARHLPAIVLTSVVLALIGSMESLLALAAIEQGFGGRPEPRRELLAQGAANIVGGALGGMPLVLLRARAVATMQAGGQGRGAALGGAVATAVLWTVGGPLLAELPRVVLAGVMVTIGVALVDRWTLSLMRPAGKRGAMLPRDAARQTLLVMSAVCLLTVTQGLTAGVVVGVLLSTLLFMQGMNRSLIRLRLKGSGRPSRRVYPPAIEQRLHGLRERVLLLELEGALFFGSGERLAQEADALPPNSRALVLDLRRVSAVDESGTVLLQQLASRLGRRGQQLLLAGLTADDRLGRSLRAWGLEPGALGIGWYADADLAMEAAERLLLAETDETAVNTPGVADDAAMPLHVNALFEGLTPADTQAVLARLRPRRLRAGEAVFRRGDAAHSMFVVERGSVSAISPLAVANRTLRYASLSAGTMFGEAALLDGGGRSADVVADVDSVVHELTREALDALANTHPEAAVQLYRNVARHLSGRLRTASAGWDAAAS